MATFGNELLICFTIYFLCIMNICNINYLRLRFGGRDFGPIASGPGHCISFVFCFLFKH